MRIFPALLAFAALSVLLWGAGPDWLNYAGDPQRSGWQQFEKYINAGNVKDLKLLWKRQLDNQSIGLNSLTAPVIIGPIFTHRGIKELVFVAGASDNIYAVDADLGRLFWKRHIEGSGVGCGGGLTSAPVIDPAVLPAKHIAGNTDVEDPRPMRPVYVLSSDGALHKIRASTGEDIETPRKFVPPNVNASSLNFDGNTFYTTTSGGCGGTPNGVWAISANTADAQASFFPSAPMEVGVSVGSDGTVYSAFGSGTIMGLTPGTLKEKESFKVHEGAVPTNASPVPFAWKGRELIAVAATRDRLLLLDAAHLGGVPVAGFAGGAGTGFSGALATWEDAADARWIYAVVRGPGPVAAKFPIRNGGTPHGSIVGFRVNERDGQPELTPMWISRDLVAPVSPVVVNGVVFALASGEHLGQASSVQERISKSTRATLYALNAATGKELYSSGDAVTSSTHSSGLAVSHGHVCFGTWDNTLYCFGFPIETQP
jgi:outer membrane protein assembly factor BamB